jgi:hypothetical protein
VRFWASLWTILRSITPYFLLGMLIAGVLSALLPDDAIPRYLAVVPGFRPMSCWTPLFFIFLPEPILRLAPTALR